MLASALTLRADQIRAAYIHWQPWRYDLQIVLEDLQGVTAEEVTILEHRTFPSDLEEGTDRECLVYPLPVRPSELQLNWSAVDESGRNLVIIPRADVERAYEELFADAIFYLRQRQDVPQELLPLVRASDWADQLFRGDWITSRKGNITLLQVFHTYFYHRVFPAFPSPPGPRQAATAVFAEFLETALVDHYRPWVILLESAPCSHDGFGGRQLVKYTIHDRLSMSFLGRAAYAALGWGWRNYPVPNELGSSTHFRLRAPTGLVFERPLRYPAGFTRVAPDRGQMEFYLSAADAIELANHQDEDERVSMSFRISQTSTTHVLTSIILALVSCLPLVLGALSKLPADARDWSLADFVERITWDNALQIAGSVTQEHVLLTTSVALPLAVTMFAAAWNHLAVRPFVVFQLALASAMLGLWIVAPFKAGWPLLPSLVIGFLSLYHAMEAVLGMANLPPEHTPKGH